ncbi:MAG: hypothetical protein AAB367_03885 [Patescibacteria group bacterium]
MTPQEFIKKFELPSAIFQEHLVEWTESLGFSAYEEHANGYASLYKIGIWKEDLEKETSLKPLHITVTYGKKTRDGLSIGLPTSGVWDPIDLISENEYFLNTKSGVFFHNNKEIRGITIIQEINKLHHKPTKTLRGFWLRTKLIFVRKILKSIIKFCFYLISYLQYILWGEYVSLYDDLKSTEPWGPLEIITQTERLKGERRVLFDIFGFKVEARIAYVYSFFHLALYLFFWYLDYKPKLLIDIFKNPFLTLMYTILSLGMTKAILSSFFVKPRLYGLLGVIQKYYYNSQLRKIRI